MIARAESVVSHVAPKRDDGDLVYVRKILLTLLLIVAFFVVRLVRLNVSRSPVAAKSAPITTSSPNAVSLPPPPAQTPARLLQAEPLDKKWTSYFAVSDHSITIRSLAKHGYKVSADYPILASAEPDVGKFNKWIKRRVLGYAHTFAWRADVERPKYTPIARGLWGLDVWCDVYYTNEHFVSLRLNYEEMLPGQMHPIDYSETINYHLKRGRPLRANDVFNRGYLKSFSDYSRKHLRERYVIPDENWLNGGTEPKVMNFPNWNIVPDGVLLSFEDYQVGPHSFGQPQFLVPFSSLEGTTRPKVLRSLLVSQ